MNEIDNMSVKWWAAGKLLAYSKQDEPFIHLDGDVFLWDYLPDRIMSSPVLAQSPEFFNKYDTSSYYRLLELEELIKFGNGWLPNYWNSYTSNIEVFEAACCGIFGGNDINSINNYSTTAIKIITENKNIWDNWNGNACGNVLVEQFFLILFLNVQGNKNIEYLFDKTKNPFSPNSSNTTYTHLIANSKNNIQVQRLVEKFILNHCIEFIPRTRKAIEAINKEKCYQE
ncbi:hypothetical protein KDU71_03850 [Carboxylicivirga sediminis]|uniref:DUF6734 domain-containing protein n=2 Tax=Carboxylicivirga sediminis TaxID=2006564 RepID=A0A941F0G4_9BACT|nr:hypothetical protein [Carboxylicivirga sediminis]